VGVEERIVPVAVAGEGHQLAGGPAHCMGEATHQRGSGGEARLGRAVQPVRKQLPPDPGAPRQLVRVEGRPTPRVQSAVVQGGTRGISVVPGDWTVLHLIWDLQKQTADDEWGQALLVLFVPALILAFIRYV
jgi:hypothetical protein